MRRVLAVDPGKATGMAAWEGGSWSAWTAHEDAAARIHRYLENTEEGHPTVLCMESFHITSNTAKKSQDGLRSVELIGVGRYLAELYGAEFKLQSPSEAKLFADNRKLRAAGFWKKGEPDHTHDAVRHLLLYLSTIGEIDLKEILDRLHTR